MPRCSIVIRTLGKLAISAAELFADGSSCAVQCTDILDQGCDYSRFRPAPLALAQRALAAAEIAALPAALIRRLRFRMTTGALRVPLTLAHRFLAPARMLARPRALSLLVALGTPA